MGRLALVLAAVAALGVGIAAAVALSGDGEDGGEPPTAADVPLPPGRPSARCDLVAASDGDDSARGTREEPLRTPGALAVRLAAGQVGCLRAGTYTQREVVLQTPSTTVRSYPDERATWRGRIVIEGDAVTLAELDLDGSFGTRCDEGSCAGGVLPSPTVTGRDVLIRGNDITSPDAGICVHPVAKGDRRPDRVRIERNRIHDCGRRPATEHDHGVYVADGEGAVISQNVIYRNADRGIQLYPNPVDIIVERNTVDGNGSGIIVSEETAGALIRENIFSNAVRRWNAETEDLSGGGNVFETNCVFANHPTDARYDEDGGVSLPGSVRQRENVVGDPRYRDRARGDFRRVAGGPCAGKGAPLEIARIPDRPAAGSPQPGTSTGP
jgi:hypothetical protein